MKYEMIFGDKALFDGAPDDAEYAGWFCQETRWYMILNGKILFSDGGTWCTSDNPYLSADIAAMRRIIKEPVAPVWTKKDRESETLPELGSLIIGESSGVVYEVIKVTKAGVVIFADTPDDVVGYYDKRDILLFFKPIESPEERSQREEDEFVESTCRQNEPHSTLYSDGVRAAYRKLKGGE